ncbi:hypothetical protein AVEN_42663-1 [Araneus ventricosus]|uniref:Uncharacterized protein n=1 Tax=Araneus ventricosus TaxID=182803 RepID=A0A4Y2BPK8_ARAVE|nr:hypothetical protein AVEN_42663-1 [Araneus ventricosus]
MRKFLIPSIDLHDPTWGPGSDNQIGKVGNCLEVPRPRDILWDFQDNLILHFRFIYKDRDLEHIQAEIKYRLNFKTLLAAPVPRPAPTLLSTDPCTSLLRGSQPLLFQF